MTRQEEIRKQISELEAELKELGKAKWPPVFKHGCAFWTVGGTGSIFGDIWRDYDSHKGALAFENAFPSEEQARNELHRIKLLRRCYGPVMPSDEVLLSGWVAGCSGCHNAASYFVDVVRCSYLLGVWKPTEDEAIRLRGDISALTEKSKNL